MDKKFKAKIPDSIVIIKVNNKYLMKSSLPI